MRSRIETLAHQVSGCRQCQRLTCHQKEQKKNYPSHHCAPVPQWGATRGRLLIVGLAPGLHGAGRTGKGFVGDDSGAFLFKALRRFGFATSSTSEEAALRKAAITNIVKCLPPNNRPSGDEKSNCLPFLREELEIFAPGVRAKPRVVLCLGSEAFYTVQSLLGLQREDFSHGKAISLSPNYSLFSSYHPSRLNVNTRRLTQDMFFDLFGEIYRKVYEADNKPPESGNECS
jgi:uracil-DNA glycosylase family 4